LAKAAGEVVTNKIAMASICLRMVRSETRFRAMRQLLHDCKQIIRAMAASLALYLSHAVLPPT
jgi:hypothetical protein